jgi:hypothetical protein
VPTEQPDELDLGSVPTEQPDELDLGSVPTEQPDDEQQIEQEAEA